MESNLLSTRYRHALDLVAVLFKNHFRKITGVPYIVHLTGVCHIVTQVSDDEDVRIAALLHDVLEDIPAETYSRDRMRADFGDAVTEMVLAVSLDTEKYGSDANREYLRQITEGPMGACVVSAADMLYNARDFIDAQESNPDSLRKLFGGSKARHRQWFWSERYLVLQNRLGKDNAVIKELEPVLKRLEAIHQEIM